MEGAADRTKIRLAVMKEDEGRDQRLELSRLAVDHASISAIWMDPGGRLIYVNNAACISLGYTEDDLLARSISDIDICLTPETWKNLWNGLKKDGSEILESVYRKADGSSFPVRVSASYIRNGGLEYACTFVHDIHPREDGQEKIPTKDDKSPDIFEGVSDAWYFHDLNGRFTETNPAFRRIFGYPEDKPLPDDFRIQDLLPEKLKASARSYLDSVTRDKKNEGLIKVLCRDGLERIIEYKNSLVFGNDGKAIGVRGTGRDITERYLYRKEMKEIEQRYRDIFDNVTDLLFFHDLDGNFDLKQCNPAVRQQLVGGNPDIATVNIRKYMPEPYRSGFDSYLERVKKKGKDEGLFTIINFAGHEVVMEYRNSLVTDKTGPIGIRGSARDISERIVYERALRKSEEKYRTILENIEHGYYEVDISGSFTFVNDSLCRIFGIPKDELFGTNFSKFADEEMAKKVYETFHTMDKTGNDLKSTEWEFITRDGRRIHIEGSISRILSRSGKCRGFRGIISDVTNRVQTEHALKESELKYRSILEGMEEGYYETDLKGGFTFFNNSMCRIIGLSRREMQGMDFREYTDDKNADKVFQAFHRAFETGKPQKGVQWDFIRKDGSLVHVESSILLIRDLDGRAMGFRGVLQDITSRKKAEEETRLLEEKLKNAQKMEALGTLAGGVAHDLNNILSGVVSYPEMLLMTLNEESPLKEPIKKIQKSGERAAAVVQDLLTLARRGVAIKEVVNVNDIIREYLNSPEYARLISLYPAIKLDFLSGESLFNIVGSPAHLSKSIMNLIFNAVEAMPEGGIVTLKTYNVIIKGRGEYIEGLPHGEYVCLRVTDTGIGISAEDISRIFEPFYTKKKMGRSGTGLGLAVVWGTVQDHGGHIDVACREGKTVFTLHFPSTRKELPETKSQKPLKDYMGNGERILVVDDNEEQCEVASDMLEFLGYEVTTVSSGEDAVSYMKDHSTDLILLDMILEQGIDGLETFERILQIHPSQKAVIASGYSETDRVKKAQNLGAGRYIKKPYLIEDLGMAVMLELRKKEGTS